MAERAIFLDRDDTIIDNDGYLGDPSKVKLLPGAASALCALRALGYRLIVVSNQSGVARGMFSEAAVQAVNDEMSRQLREAAGAHIDASYYCPYHPEAPVAEYRIDHDWRKPKPGMLMQAAHDFRLELSQCWMVGDMDRDIAAGAAAGCRTILLHNPDLRPDRKEKSTVQATFICRTLADAARIIAREGINPPHVMIEAQPTQPPAPPGAPAKTQADTKAQADGGGSPVVAASLAVAPVVSEARSPAMSVGISARTELELTTQRAVPPAPIVDQRTPAPVAPAPGKPQEVRGGTGASGSSASPQFEHALDELVIQLRQQNRHAQLRPDFSAGNMAALIVQVLAVVMLFLGLFKLFTLKATFTANEDYLKTMISCMQSIAWMCGGVVMQGIVLALLLHTRQK